MSFPTEQKFALTQTGGFRLAFRQLAQRVFLV